MRCESAWEGAGALATIRKSGDLVVRAVTSPAILAETGACTPEGVDMISLTRLAARAARLRQLLLCISSQRALVTPPADCTADASSIRTAGPCRRRRRRSTARSATQAVRADATAASRSARSAADAHVPARSRTPTASSADPAIVRVPMREARPLTITLRVAPVSDAVVVSAAQVPRPLSEIAGNASTVIARDDIEARQLENVADALRTVPGFTVGRNGGRGALTSVFPRGGESDYTLVLVDGMRVNAFGGGFDFSLLPFGDVEQVEVVRGPQSAVFGSDAIGGIVSVTTRHGGPADRLGLDRRRLAGVWPTPRAGGAATRRAVVVRRRRGAHQDGRLHGHRAGNGRTGDQRRLARIERGRRTSAGRGAPLTVVRGDYPLARQRARQSRALRFEPDWRLHRGRSRLARLRHPSAGLGCRRASRGVGC